MNNFYGIDNGYGYGYGMGNVGPSLGSQVWTIVSLILALIGCFLVYYLFVVSKQKQKVKFLVWLKEFLSFDKMLIEPILKITYLFFVIFLTLYSFIFIGSNMLMFLLIISIGNIVLRLVFEGMLIMIMIWKNTSEINKKLK